MYTVVTSLAKPYPLLFFMLGAGLVVLCRRQQCSKRLRWWLVSVYAVLYLISTPLVGHLAMASLESWYPPSRGDEFDAPVMVVLSGSMFIATETHPRATLGESTLHRCLRAAEIYRQQPRFILVAGRTRDDGASVASLMKAFLMQLGIPQEQILVDEESRNTAESAVNARQILHEHDVDKILLVSDASHLYRTERAFAKAGFSVQPVGCHYRARQLSWNLNTFLPSPSAAQGVHIASHEVLGIAWYWLRGRL